MHFILAVGRLVWDWSEAPVCDTVGYSTAVLLHYIFLAKQNSGKAKVVFIEIHCVRCSWYTCLLFRPMDC